MSSTPQLQSPTRVLIMGIGNRLRTDDAIGSIVGEHFARLGKVPAIDCGDAPENFLSKVFALKPEEIIFVDACDFGGIAGEVRVFEASDFDRVVYGLLLSHTLPLTLLANLIRKELKCRIRLVGIQPQSVMFGEGLSERVAAALPQVIATVQELVGADRA